MRTTRAALRALAAVGRVLQDPLVDKCLLVLAAFVLWLVGRSDWLFLPIAFGTIETTTTLAKILKEFYPGGGIVNQVNVATYLLDKVDKAKTFRFNGKYFAKPARFGLLGAAGPRAEGVALPAGGTSLMDQVQITSKYHYGVIEVSGPVIAVSKSDKGAFKSAITENMDTMFDEFRLIANIMLHGFGTGVLGLVSSVAASVITLVDNVLPPQWFFNNMKIDSYQANEATLRQAAMKITDVDLANRTITVDVIGATAATDRLYLASGKDVAFDGLLSSVDDSTYKTVHFNIDRSVAGRKAWKSYINAQGGAATKYGNATRRSLTTTLIQQGLDQQQIRAQGRAIDLFYSSLGVRRSYFQALSPARQFNNEVFDGGWAQLKYSNGDRAIPWQADWMALNYTLFGLHTGVAPSQEPGRASKVEDEELLSLFEVQDADWDDSTGSQFKQMYSGGNLVDAITAFLKWYATWGSCKPNAHARWDDLVEITA